MPMTYNSLTGSISEQGVVTPGQIMTYLKRNDASTFFQQPDFIAQAEQRICREAKTIGLERYVTGQFVIGQPVVNKPADWRRSLTFTYTGSRGATQIYHRNYEYLRLYWPDAALQGAPLYYGDFGYTQLVVVPTPDQAYPFLYGYVALPTPLSPTNQTNWLTDYAPDLLLYAILLETTPFLKNDERIPVWESAYSRGLASLNQQNDQRRLDRASNEEAN